MMRKLSALLAALLLTACATHRPQAQLETPAERLGWQLAIHERTFLEYSIFAAMDKTAALGVKYMSLSAKVKLDGNAAVPVANLTDAQIESIRKYAQARGLTLVNAYVPFSARERECRREFEFARKMGLDLLVGEPEPEALDTVEKLCREYNIRVAIHDHPRPSHYWSPETVLAAIRGRSPLLGACADTGHWMRSGLDPVQCLHTLGGHIMVLHFKDLTERNKKGHDVPWGTGVGNCRGMMAELQRQGFHGAFCVEYEYPFDSAMTELAGCVRFFNDTCSQLSSGLSLGNCQKIFDLVNNGDVIEAGEDFRLGGFGHLAAQGGGDL